MLVIFSLPHSDGHSRGHERIRGQPKRASLGLVLAVVLHSLCGLSTLSFLLPAGSLSSPTSASPLPRRVQGSLRIARSATEGDAQSLSGLDVVIVGAGPSGLLLAHRLLQGGASVHILEARSDPRSPEAGLEGRAYALGLGIRGRTAIRTAGEDLWTAITPNGFGSERFQLHFSPTSKIDLRTPEDGDGLEPSLLVYQSDLCGAMLDHLQSSFGNSGRLQLSFRTRVETVDPVLGLVTAKQGDQNMKLEPASLIAGCDGVNSAVRSAIASACNDFEAKQSPLPGNVKVIRFPSMPGKIDATAVHAIPGKGGTSAFVEPTAHGGCVLINWRDEKAGDKADKAGPQLGKIMDAVEATSALKELFPLLDDVMDEEAGKQFVQQNSSRSSTVRCSTYHFGRAVLLGDAAHSTGGVSGQGCNSALQDAAALGNILEEKRGDVASSLLSYSQERVPEGHALLELSLGPGEDAGPLRRAFYGMSTFLGTLLSRFRIGEPPLQTLLTTSLKPFAEIRRDRDFYFGDFPSQREFDALIASAVKDER